MANVIKKTKSHGNATRNNKRKNIGCVFKMQLDNDIVLNFVCVCVASICRVNG